MEFKGEQNHKPLPIKIDTYKLKFKFVSVSEAAI